MSIEAASSSPAQQDVKQSPNKNQNNSLGKVNDASRSGASEAEPSWTFHHYKFLSILFFGYYVQYFSRVAVDLSAPTLEKDKELERGEGTEISDIFAYALLAYSFGKLFGGPLADRFGGKAILCLALGCIAGGNFLVSRATSLNMFILFWASSRFFHAFCHPSVARLCKAWFTNNRFSTAYSIAMAAPITGSITASILLGPILASSHGWRGCMTIAAIAATCILSIIILFLKSAPPSQVLQKHVGAQKAAASSEADDPLVKSLSTGRAILMFFQNSRFWLCLLGACTLTVLYEFQSLLSLYLSSYAKLDAQTAAMTQSAFPIGGIISLLTFGALYEKLSFRKRAYVVFGLLTVGILCLKCFTVEAIVTSYPALVTLIFLYACCIAPVYNLVPSMFAVAFAGEKFAGTIFSVIDVPAFFSAMLFFKSYPILLAMGDWHLVLNTLIFVCLLAMMFTVLLLFLESKSPSPVFYKKFV